MNLDKYQKIAAYQNNPFSIIIAGAGTGKTFTLLGRIKYLIEVRHFKPEEILVISFTNETVNDFKEKAKKILGFSLNVFTFHKLSIYILQHANYEFFLVDDHFLTYLSKEFLYSYCRQNSLLKKYVHGTFSLFNFNSFDKLEKSGKLNKLHKELIKFIHLWTAKGFDNKKFYQYFNKSKIKEKNFLTLCFILLQFYESEKSSQHFLDFDDLICKAIKLLKDFNNFPFRHILVDEFQDSSYNRILFLRNIVNHFNMEFTVVGDDCQSIYRFNGTESNCFDILHYFFPNLKMFYLKYTYRNSQELIDIANKFILKNPIQLKKDIYSISHFEKPIEILFYSSPKKIFKILHYILMNKGNDGILFLGRNSFDWKYYFNENEIFWNGQKLFSLNLFPDDVFKFLTIHQSKGLESDIVVILHVENGLYGFPNKMVDSHFSNIFSFKDNIPYEEERRLFYVALTRAKKRVYILSSIFSPSTFVIELIHDNFFQITKKFF